MRIKNRKKKIVKSIDKFLSLNKYRILSVLIASCVLAFLTTIKYINIILTKEMVLFLVIVLSIYVLKISGLFLLKLAIPMLAVLLTLSVFDPGVFEPLANSVFIILIIGGISYALELRKKS